MCTFGCGDAECTPLVDGTSGYVKGGEEAGKQNSGHVVSSLFVLADEDADSFRKRKRENISPTYYTRPRVKYLKKNITKI